MRMMAGRIPCDVLGMVLMTVVWGVQGQNLNSGPHVETLVHMESEMIDLARTVLREETHIHNGLQELNPLQNIHPFLGVVEPLNRAAIADVTSMASDVMKIYTLKRRLSRDWLPVLDLLQQTTVVKRVPLTSRRLMSMQYLIDENCDVSMFTIKDILRLQHFYKLRPEDLISAGSAMKLDADDIARIATGAERLGHHQMALQWIQTGYQMCNASGISSTRQLFLSLKARIYLKTKQFTEAEAVYAELLDSVDAKSRSVQSSLQLIRQKIQDSPQTSNTTRSDAELSDDQYLHHLCRGNVVPRLRDSLKCYTKHIADLPAPIKIEELNDYPRVVVIRDLIRRAEVRHIVRSASEEIGNKMVSDQVYRLAVARVRKERDAVWLRTLSSAYVNATFQGRNVRRDDILSRIVVTNEGAGGPPDLIVNQRWRMRSLEDMLPIGNFVLFLNDVTSGGGVAFPELHLKVDAEEGAVVFWQFKTRWGPVAPPLRRYLHCPVQAGSQWLAKTSVRHQGLLTNIHL